MFEVKDFRAEENMIAMESRVVVKSSGEQVEAGSLLDTQLTLFFVAWTVKQHAANSHGYSLFEV